MIRLNLFIIIQRLYIELSHEEISNSFCFLFTSSNNI